MDMKKSNSMKWIVLACSAALLSAAVTAVLFLLRSRKKEELWYEEDDFDGEPVEVSDFDEVDIDDIPPTEI